MAKLANRVRVASTTTGTGPIALGAASPGFQTFAAAGVLDGHVVSYTIEDGDAWEVGTGTYSASGPTLSRTVLESSSGGSPLPLTGNAVVFVTATAADLQNAVDMDQSVATTDSPTFVDLTISDKIVHASDTDTAIRFPAADTFTVETAGAERLRITPGGSVGIGTSDPAENLDIRSADTYQLALTQASVGNAVLGVNPSNILDIRRIGFTPITLSTNNTERLRITSDGNVGIGTSSPVSNLHVSGNPANITLRDEDAPLNGYWQLGARGGAGEIAVIDVDPNNVIGNSNFRIAVDGSDRFHINTTGDVGIGTSSPSAKLHSSISSSGAAVVGGASVAGFFEASTLAGVQISSGSGSPSFLFMGDAADVDATRIAAQDGFAQISASGASDYMRFDAGGFIERMRITSAGSVGIGTSSPNERLEVNGQIRISSTAPYLSIFDTNAVADEKEWRFLGNDGSLRLQGISDSGAGGGGYAEFARVGNNTQAFKGYRAATLRTDLSWWDSYFLFSNELGTLGTATAHDLAVKTNNTERLRITSTGNVGIGTSSPQRPLHIAGPGSCELIIQSLAAPVDQGRVRARVSSVGDFYIDFTNDGVSQAQNGYTMGRGTGFSVNSHTFRTNATERLHITSTGNVGIGTSNPLDKLHVVGAARLAGLTTEPVYLEIGRDRAGDGNSFIDLVGDTTYTDYGLRIIRNPGANAGSVIDSRGIGPLSLRTPDAGAITLLTTNTERLRITSTGDVGIGTSAPARRVHVTSAQQIVARFESETTAAGRVSLMDANTTTDASVGFGSVGDSLALITGGTESARIDSSGNVGIGTGNPQASLHISGAIPRIVLTDTDTGADSRLDANFGSGTLFLAADFNNEATNSLLGFSVDGFERMRIDSSGNVLVGQTSTSIPGINNTTTGVSISPSGVIYLSADAAGGLNSNRNADGSVAAFRRSGTIVGSINVTTTATSYLTSSDYRLKEDVQPMVGACDRVLALNPVNFAWKVDGARVDGFLAHEAQAVVPESVTGEKDGEEMQAIDQSKLVPLLTAALQEALQKIEALEARLTALEA